MLNIEVIRRRNFLAAPGVYKSSVDIKIIEFSSIFLQAKNQELVTSLGVVPSSTVMQEIGYRLLPIVVLSKLIYQANISRHIG